MKKEYNYWVNKQNTPHLKLYTQLLVVFDGALGLNFLLIFLYTRFCINYEYNILILVLSILMFCSIPDRMSDPRKGNRDLGAVIAGSIVHGVCTIASAVFAECYWLLLVYVVEFLIVILVIIRYFRKNFPSRINKRNKKMDRNIQ